VKQTDQLGIREYICLAILMASMRGTEHLPSMLYRQAQNAAWMLPILSAVLFFIPLFLLLKTLSVFQGKNLFDVIRQLLGKYVSFLVCLLIFLISSFAVSVDSRIYSNIISTYYFLTTPNLIIYAIFMFVCAYGAVKGIQRIGSISYLTFFYIAFSFFIAFLLSLQDSQLEAIFPIWGPGTTELVRASTTELTLYADFFILTILIPYVTSYKDFRNGTWFSFVCVSIQLSFATVLFITLFDNALKGLDYPFHTAIRYISLGEFLPNIETLFLPIWLFGVFIRFSAFIYINALMFSQLFQIKDYKFLIPSIATIYLMIGMIPENAIDTFLLKGIVGDIAGPTFSVISIILWLAAWFKGEFKHAKNKSSH